MNHPKFSTNFSSSAVSCPSLVETWDENVDAYEVDSFFSQEEQYDEATHSTTYGWVF